MKNVIHFCLAFSFFCCAQTVSAQEDQTNAVSYVQFAANPTAVNPALAGMFAGGLRVSAVYRQEWLNRPVLLDRNFSVSADAPVFVQRSGDYLGVGIQLSKGLRSDENIRTSTGGASLAYHKFIGSARGRADGRTTEIAVGLQGGYNYENGDFQYFVGWPVRSTATLNHTIGAYLYKAGISFAHSSGKRFYYRLSLSGELNNTHQLREYWPYTTVIAKVYSGTFDADWAVARRLTIRPFILFQEGLATENYQLSVINSVVGGELQYRINKFSTNEETCLSVGSCFSMERFLTITGGVKIKRLQLGLGYNYGLHQFYNVGNNGLDISLKYIAPHSKFSKDKDTKTGNTL
jgi:hypothetical protein